MGIFYSPTLVKDGLVLCLDASNPRSYPGSGTAWKDLTSNNINAYSPTITYDSSNNGSLVLDRSTNYFSFGHNLLLEPANITIIAWINLLDISDRHILITKWLGWSFEIGADRYPYFRVNGSSVTDLFSTVPITWGSWCQIASTFDDINNIRTIAINGIVNNTVADTGSISYNQSGFNIPYVGNPSYGKGKISSLYIYNRALSATEILQNFNATKSRFGL